MRPIRLRMNAFGPYSKAVEIDFRKLAESSLAGGGIFLIHGQTGAGKTSILDGICFALFGSSSGADRDGESLRSDLALSDVATEVTLEFALGPDIHRITRRPRQHLKKKRGDGLTPMAPTAGLYRLATGLGDDDIDGNPESWRLLASGTQKADTAVIDLIGMSADQFRQVVVLPQGQFRKFLSSHSESREKLLEILFRTERHRRITDLLASRAQELEGAVASRKQQLEAQLQSLEIEAGDSLATKIEALETEARTLAAETPAMEERFKTASERKHTAQLAARTKVDLANTEARLKTLLARRPAVESARLKLADERRSRPVLTLDHRVLTLERELKELADAQERERAALVAFERELKTHRESRELLESLAPELENWRTERTRLLDLWSNAARLKEIKVRLQELETAFSTADAKARNAEATLAETGEQRLKRQQEVESHAELASQVDAIRARIDLAAADLVHLSENIQTLDEAEKNLASEKQRLERQQVFAEEARKALQKLKLAYHLSQAAQLARELKPGEPCPVCGSAEHPSPAHALDAPSSDTHAVTPEEMEAAEKRLNDIIGDLTSSAVRRETAEEAVRLNNERLLARFPGAEHVREHAGRMRDERSRALDALKDRLELARQTALEWSKATDALKIAEGALAQADLAHRAARAERDEARAKFESIRGQAAELEAAVAPEYRDPDAIKPLGQELAKKIKERETKIEETQRLFESASRAEAGARARLKTLAEQHQIKIVDNQNETRSRDHALHESGFATLDDCRKAGLTPEESRESENLCRLFDAEWTAANERLAELQREAGEIPEWAHDLDARTAELEALDTERSARKARLLSLTENIARLGTARERIATLQGEIEKAETRYRSIGRLAAVAQGQLPHNPARVNFSRYVLATRLDEVLEHASRRLHTMSRGQFILKRATGQEDRRRSGGLDLEVEDSFSGTARATASLSGGEGFMASLALALGLADVVQSRLGGVRLETVFVDEGFGTLDSETLELAMKTLTDLQAGGRLVGVISHVPELREQISKRLVVRKAATGSTVSWEGALDDPGPAGFTRP